MAKINIQNGIISSSDDYGLYHGSSKVANVQDGEFRVIGDLIAENYIISSSVTSLTYQSLSGSTIFGDSSDDTHEFVGNTISGSSTSTGSFGQGFFDNRLYVGSAHASEKVGIKISQNDDWGLRLENTYDGGYGALVKVAGSSANELVFQARAGSNNILTILANEKTGIGTNSPDEKLHIYEDTHGANLVVKLSAENDSGTHRPWYIENDPDAPALTFIGEVDHHLVLDRQTGNVGIGASSPKTHLDVQSYQADGITIGADNDANKTRTNSTTKSGGITGVHYTNAEESIRIIGYSSTSDTNGILIGGGNSDWNAATKIDFWTAANFNTTGGTKTLTIAPNTISGSATSTGSFGSVVAGGTGFNTFVGNVGIGNTAPEHPLMVTGTGRFTSDLTVDGDIYLNHADGLIYLNNVGTGNNGVYIAGIDADNLRLHAPSGKLVEVEIAGVRQFSVDGSSTTAVGNIISTGANKVISGSSTSTGSFGAVHAADKVRIGLTNDDSPHLLEMKAGATGGDFILGRQSDDGQAFRVGLDSGDDAFLELGSAGTSDVVVLRADGTSHFNGGDVGIGVSPDEVLHIKHTEAVIKLEDSSVTGAGYIDFDGGSLQLNTNRNPNTGANENSSKSHASIILGGNGASSYINFYTAPTANTTGTSRLYISGSGEIGIGTTSPSAALDISGDVTIDGGGLTIEDTGEYLRFTDGNASIRRNSNDMQFYAYSGFIFSNNPGESFRIDNSGNLQMASGKNITSTGNITTTGYISGSATGSFGYGLFAGNVTMNGGSGDFHTGGARLAVYTPGGAGIPALYLDGGGNGDALHINAGNNDFDAAQYAIKVQDQNSSNVVFGIKKSATAEADDKFEMYMSGDITGSANATFAGKVGIGTTSPAQILHLKGAVPSILFDDSTNGYLAYIGDAQDFLTGDSPGADSFGIRSEGDIRLGTGGNNLRMTINSSGNVGIGTASPATKLDVKGEISSSGDITIMHTDGDPALWVRNSSSSQNAKIHIGEVNTTAYGLTIRYEGNLGNVFFDNHYNHATRPHMYFRMKTAGTPITAMTIDPDGQIGIGTSSPGSLLTIKDTGDISTATFISGITGDGFQIIDGGTDGVSMEIDNIMVRNTLRTHIFQKDVVKATNGILFISDSGVISGSNGSDSITFMDDKSATFSDDDELWYKDIDENTGEIRSVKFKINGSGTSAGGMTTYDIDGVVGDANYLTGSIGGTAVRISGGSLVLDASSNNSPYMDVNASSGSAVVRTGNLAGVTSARFGTLSGFGMWASGSVYLEGAVNATTGNIGGWGISDTAISSSDNIITLDGDAKRITIKSDSTTDRIYLGEVDGGSTYGMKIFDGNGTADANRLVELGAGGNMIAGWDLLPGSIKSDNADGSVALSATSQSLTIWTGSIDHAEPKLVLGKLPLHDGTVDSPYGLAVFSGTGTVSGSEASASVLVTANKARLAGWELVPGQLKSGTVADINGNKASIALGTGATSATATPTANLFFVSASTNPVFYVGENFSYVDDVLTAAGWTVDTSKIKNGTDIELDATNKRLSLNNNAMAFGFGVGGTGKHGLHIDSNNHIYSTGEFIFGGASQYISASNGNLEISSSGFYLSPTGTATFDGTIKSEGGLIGGFKITTEAIYEASNTVFLNSAGGGYLAAGPNAHSMGESAGTGFFASGSGYFRMGDSTGNSFYYKPDNGALVLTGKLGGSSTSTGSFGQLHVRGQVNSAANPTLNFGDGDTGLWNPSDDQIRWTFGGSEQFRFDAGGIFGGSNGNPYMIDEVASSTNPVWTFVNDTNTGIGQAGADTGSLVAGGTNVLNWTGNGYVGIGTTGPVAPLHISTTANAITGTDVDVSNLQFKIINPANDTDEAVGLGFALSTNEENIGAAIIHDRSGSESYGNLHFATKASGEAGGADIPINMTLDSSGNLGIGTTSPATPVHIIGPTAASSPYISDCITIAPANYPARTWQFRYDDGGSTGNGFSIAAADTRILYLNANGYVGIGTARPTGELELKFDTNKHMVFSDSQGEVGNCPSIHAMNTAGSDLVDFGIRADNILLATGNAERMRVTDDGVGIGNTNPPEALSVTGNISGSGNVIAENFSVNDAVFHTGDDDTKIAFSGDNIDFYAGNAKLLTLKEDANDAVIINEDAGDVNFRVESSNVTSMLKVDGGTDRVGIGQGTPTAVLHVETPDYGQPVFFTKTPTDDAGTNYIANEMEFGDTSVNSGACILHLNFSSDSTILTTHDFIRFSDGGGEVGRIHSEVLYGTFTGGHISQRPSGSSYDDWKPGMIVKSTGNILATGSSISLAWPEVELTTTQKDKAVMGVFSETGSAGHNDSHLDRTLPRINYNAVGEGMIRVTDTNGNIETGDYICSSTRTGHGEKQDDDLLHNYTVAKATQPYNFTSASNDADLGYKSVLIACTYHCG